MPSAMVVPGRSLAEVVAVLQATRGIDLIAAVGGWPRLVISPASKSARADGLSGSGAHRKLDW